MSERWVDELRRRLAAEAQAKFDLRVDTYSEEIQERCESPIERLLATQFASLDWELGEGGRLEWQLDPNVDSLEKFKDDLAGLSEDASQFRCGRLLWGWWTGIIAPQITIGQWRVDFLAGVVFSGFRGQAEAPSCLLAIECDGHDFHERTKEQAARDRARDRQIQALGIGVFRFTGSQIYRDPQGCANEVAAYFNEWAGPHEEEFKARLRAEHNSGRRDQ